MTKRQLRKQLKEFSHKTEPSTTLYSGALGIYIGGHQYVDVPNRPGFVYVRLRNNTSELIQAHNEVVSPVYGLPVILVRNKTYYEIYGRDSVQYASYWDSSSSYLPKHGHQHEFDPNNNGGGDLVFVHGEQFYPMMTFPSGTDGGNTVLIAPYRYYYSSAWHYAGDTGAGNLLQYGPTGASNAKLLLVGIDATTGNPFVKLGSEFDASITGAAALTSYIPTNITQSTEIPGAIVRLVTGTSTITWANIYDARQYMGILQAAGGATTFLGLTDTPNSYAGQADKLLVVNSAANAVEFRTNTGSSGITTEYGPQFDFMIDNANSDISGYKLLILDRGNDYNNDYITWSVVTGSNQFIQSWVTAPLQTTSFYNGTYKIQINDFRQDFNSNGTLASVYFKIFVLDSSGAESELITTSTYTLNGYSDKLYIPINIDWVSLGWASNPQKQTILSPGYRFAIKLYANVTVANGTLLMYTGPGSRFSIYANNELGRMDYVPKMNAILTGTFAANNTTTLADVLSVYMNMGIPDYLYPSGYRPRTYAFEARLFVEANAVGGHKYAIKYDAFTSIPMFRYQVNSINNGNNSFVINSMQTGSAGIGQSGATGAYTEIKGTIQIDDFFGSNLTLQFAQNVATGTSNILPGSTLILIEL